MVQLLVDPAFSPTGTPMHEIQDGTLVTRPSFGRTDSFAREEHAQRMRELNSKRAQFMRTPRRGWSLTDYQCDESAQQQQPPAYSNYYTNSSQRELHASIPEHAAIPDTPQAPVPVHAPAHSPILEETPQKEGFLAPPKPKLPPPRRSYSVMDYEPFPPDQPMPPKDYTLLDLPAELHYAIFDYLDPIDSVCFGLTNSNFYEIHRLMNGTVPLSSRYSGPNDREWAWRGAGPLLHRHERVAAKESAMEQMRVKGQVYCRKCGISRCELHRHIKEWMGEGYEYCSIKEIYGPPAGEDQKPYCYMKSPKNPHRCGRHGKKVVHKDDA